VFIGDVRTIVYKTDASGASEGGPTRAGVVWRRVRPGGWAAGQQQTDSTPAAAATARAYWDTARPVTHWHNCWTKMSWWC